jgi:hypothetical protein
VPGAYQARAVPPSPDDLIHSTKETIMTINEAKLVIVATHALLRAHGVRPLRTYADSTPQQRDATARLLQTLSDIVAKDNPDGSID